MLSINRGGGGVKEVREWLREKLKERGVSQKALSEAWGAPSDAVNKFLRGVREISAEELFKTEQIVNATAPRHNDNPEVRAIVQITVVGEVAGGVWREMDYEDFDEYFLDYPIDPRWPTGSVKALRVRGNSINRQARDGDHVVVLDIAAAPRWVQDGDWVVVNRTRSGTVESTVKRVRGKPGEWLLCPDSDDPRFQDPIPLLESTDAEVHVVGFVLDFFRPGTRF
jgi:SOS-response transcriptional repressor LexA